MAEADPYQGQERGLAAFGRRFEVITPDDDNDIYPYKAIICGATGGAVSVHNHEGDVVVLWAVPGMALQGVRPRRILEATVAEPLIGIL